MVKEHAKLIIQSSFACKVLREGWYSNDQNISEQLASSGARIDEIAATFDKKAGLELNVIECLFAINRELRDLHEARPSLFGGEFDKSYEPLGGYARAVDRFLEGFWIAD